MDGLGSDSATFKNVAIQSVTTSVGAELPVVFAASTFKADFLAARATILQGLTMIDKSDDGWSLHSEDTGTYANTLDYAVYGEPIALLTLGARAALDVLDKNAVALNQYLELGEDPAKVNYRCFWYEKKTAAVPVPPLRRQLLTVEGGHRADPSARRTRRRPRPRRPLLDGSDSAPPQHP